MHVTTQELQLISDRELIERKRAAIETMMHHFHQLAAFLFKHLEAEQLLQHTAFTGKKYKVTRGENFHGFPFVVLDTPGLAGGNMNLAMRTLFWWGHHFSCQFILLQEKYSINNNYLNKLLLLNTRIYTGGDVWEQNADSPFFIPLTEENYHAQKFLKLCITIPLGDSEKLETLAFDFYRCCLKMTQAK